jgi:photosystem II stability/assembly factor-like uncharacterized protein
MSKNRLFNSLVAVLLGLAVSPAPRAEGIPGGTIQALAMTTAGSPTLYAGTVEGLYTSRNDGRDWSSAGLEQAVNDVLAHPGDAQVLYVAAGNAGVMKSENGGKDWTALPVATSGQPDFRALAIDRSRPATVYAASFQGHIYRSNDDGRSWSVLNPEFPFQALNAIVVEGSTLYVGTGGNGVFKSTDGGSDWVVLNEGLDDLTVTRLLLDPANPGTIYAGTYGSGVFVSGDAGRHWKAANDGLGESFVYALTGRSDTGKRGANLLVGVYGGSLYKGTANGAVRWQPFGEAERKL